MSTALGGTLGITFNDSTTLTAANVSGKLSPYLTNASNTMTINGKVIVDGSGSPLGSYQGVKTPNLTIRSSLTITGNNNQLNLRTWALANGWNGTSAATIYIAENAVIWSNTTGTAALTIDGSWPGGVTVYNYGAIIGKGGAGGNYSVAAPVAGSNAISLGVSCTIYNYGYILGGGGGGSGGYNAGGGGGAGGGAGGNGQGGAGGAGGTFTSIGYYGLYSGYNGVTGTFVSGKSNVYGCGGGGGGIQVPGAGAPPSSNSIGGYGGGAGGGGGGGGSGNSGSGGTMNSAGVSSGANEGAGGGGYGASGGSSYQGGAAGGKAIALNGFTCTRFEYGVTWGAVS